MLFLLIAMLVNFQTKGSNTNFNNISFILNTQQENNNNADDPKDIDVFYLMRLIQFLHKENDKRIQENNERIKENKLMMKILLPIHYTYNNISNDIKGAVIGNCNNSISVDSLKNQVKDLQDDVNFLNNRINTLEAKKENNAISPTAQKKRKNDFVVESPTKKRKPNNNNEKNN